MLILNINEFELDLSCLLLLLHHKFSLEFYIEWHFRFPVQLFGNKAIISLGILTFKLIIAALCLFLTSISTINRLKADISPNKLALLNLNEGLTYISLYIYFFSQHFLNSLTFLQHSSFFFALQLFH